MRTVILTLGLALTLSACSGKAPEQPNAPPQVGYVTLRLEPVTLTTELPGRTRAYETSDVRPQVNGIILARLFEEGDMVRRGQPLYRIEPSPYHAQVASAQAALARAQAAIASSEALARRYGELVKINAVSRQEYDNAQTAAQQARADVAAQQAVLDTAKIDLARTMITAPISGRIGRSDVTTGALVTAGQAIPLTTIQRLDPIFVDITQSSTDILRLRQQIMSGDLARGGGATRIRLKLEDGSTYPAEGTFKFTDVTVDPTTGTQTVRAVFPNPDGLLLPGMYARAELVEGTRQNAILVPQRAVSRDEKGRPTVLVVGKTNIIEPRILAAARTQGDNWVVSSGLKLGERVIVEGAQMLMPGTVVTPKPWSPATAPTRATAPSVAR